MGIDALPATPATVGTYLASLAGRLAVAKLIRRLAAISTTHRLTGHRLDTRHPAIHDLLRSIRRQHGGAGRRVAPATTSVMQAMAASCGTSLVDLRDDTLARRSELAACRARISMPASMAPGSCAAGEAIELPAQHAVDFAVLGRCHQGIKLGPTFPAA